MRWFGWLRRGKGRAGAKASTAAQVPYVLPHDLEERIRLDFQHYLLRYMLRGNFVAPIGDPREILDVGRGTGRWAIEMAQQFPRANVAGLDVAVPSRSRLDGRICEMLARRGVDAIAGEHLAEFLAGAGSQQIQARQLDAPNGDYGGWLGRVVTTDLFSEAEALRGPVVALGLTTGDDFDHMLAEVRLTTMRQPGSVQPFYIVYGQKPV